MTDPTGQLVIRRRTVIAGQPRPWETIPAESIGWWTNPGAGAAAGTHELGKTLAAAVALLDADPACTSITVRVERGWPDNDTYSIDRAAS